MPTYVYACQGCDQQTELRQSVKDEPLKECPHCGGSVRRVLFPPAVVYKGSGFYTTDYKKSGSSSSSSAGSATGGSSADSASENGSSESKTETTTETKSESKETTPAAK